MKKDSIIVLDQPTKLSEVQTNLFTYPDFLKGVVDIRKGIIALGGELHADAEARLLERGSNSKNLWGFNLYWNNLSEPIAYESLINIKPRLGNRSIVVSNEKIQQEMKTIIDRLVLL
jgi:hypothetical protein